MKRLVVLLASFAVLFGVNAVPNCTPNQKINYSPLGFLVGVCEHIKQIQHLNELLLTRLIPVNKLTHFVISEYKLHLDNFSPTICVELKLHHGHDWEKLLPREFSPDDVYNILMCHHDFIKSFVFRNPVPRELEALQASSIAELKWLVNNVHKLNAAYEIDVQTLNLQPNY